MTEQTEQNTTPMTEDALEEAITAAVLDGAEPAADSEALHP